jgi:uncharacterized protein YjiS (DUF1127 family)
MLLIYHTFEKDLIIMSASPWGANVSPAVLLPHHSARRMRLAWLIGLFRRPDSLEDLRHLPDVQLRDIGIERHRIGPAAEPHHARWPSW